MACTPRIAPILSRRPWPSYGLWLPARERTLLRFVNGRPISPLTCAFLAWAAEQLAAEGVRVLALIWDNASWHISREVQDWVRRHNREVKRSGHGCRLLICRLPSRSPWLNPIEPKWVHGKRAVVEPARKLTGAELKQRPSPALPMPASATARTTAP